MKTEIEVRILEINIEEITQRLNELGAEKIIEREMKRYIYDFNPERENSWIRLRDDGKNATLTIKDIQKEAIDGVKELEIVVDDIDKTNQILETLGYFYKYYQENKRVSYVLGGVAIEIDSWPQIPPYLEIEGDSVEEVEKTVEKLGFSMNETTSISTKKVYEKYGIDLHSIRELKF